MVKRPMLGLAVAWICGLLIAKWQLLFGKSIFILIYFILILAILDLFYKKLNTKNSIMIS